MGREAHCKFGHFVFFAGLISCLGTAFSLDRVELRPEDFVYVCRDAGAGGYEAFPDVCRLQDGRLMAVFYAGYGHVSLPDERLPRGGRISYCLSGDEGRTWSEARILYDGPDDDRDPSIVQLSNGSLICNFFSLRKKETVKEKEAPWTGLGSWMVVSRDAGKTWSEPRLISTEYYCSAPLRELPDGRVILGLYRQTGKKSHGAVIISEDGGKAWGKPVDIDNGGYKLDAETDVIRLKDGSLYAVQREPKTTMCYSVSRDGGRTWSVSRALGFPGHCPYLLRTPDDIIILAHRLPQTSLHYSRDEAETWSGTVLVDDVGGAYPSMVNLRDGSVLIVYYEEGEGSSIRARRFRATKAGIRWLSGSVSRELVRDNNFWQ
ncbi:MAG: glycoside hydrolase [Candidatus Aminicenantes bacterium]|nr:glycoside hydrolase [Candidatus Aminicenantes bacterium]